MHKTGSKRGGFSLLEVVMALGVLAVSFFGVISLLALLQSQNQTQHESRWAYKACQKALEWALELDFATYVPAGGGGLVDPLWSDPSTPGAPRFFANVTDPYIERLFRDKPHEGLFIIRDVSNEPDPSAIGEPLRPAGTVLEVTVRLRSVQLPSLQVRPLDVSLTTYLADSRPTGTVILPAGGGGGP